MLAWCPWHSLWRSQDAFFDRLPRDAPRTYRAHFVSSRYYYGKRRYPEAVSIFLQPPSLTELRRRLAARGTDGPEVIRRRLANAQGEMRQIIHYDYYVVNRDVKEAVCLLSSIVEAERAKVSRVTEWRIDPIRRSGGR